MLYDLLWFRRRRRRRRLVVLYDRLWYRRRMLLLRLPCLQFGIGKGQDLGRIQLQLHDDIHNGCAQQLVIAVGESHVHLIINQGMVGETAPPQAHDKWRGRMADKRTPRPLSLRLAHVDPQDKDYSSATGKDRVVDACGHMCVISEGRN
jgi:hypothetical protein